MDRSRIPVDHQTMKELSDFLEMDVEERNVLVEIDGEDVRLDPSIADLVVYLNEAGYPTYGCGSGVLGEHYDFSKFESDWEEIENILGDSVDYILDGDGEIDLTMVARVVFGVRQEIPFLTTELWFEEVDVDEGVTTHPDYFKMFGNFLGMEVNGLFNDVYLSQERRSSWDGITSSGSLEGHYSFNPVINRHVLFDSREGVREHFGLEEDGEYDTMQYESMVTMESYDEDMRGCIDLMHILLKGFIEHGWRVGSSSIDTDSQTFEVWDVNEELLASGDIDEFIDRHHIEDRITTYESLL